VAGVTGEPRIRVVRGGPLLVEGGPPLVRLAKDQAGTWTSGPDLAAGESFALCRCGASSSLPFCDNAPTYACFEEEEPSGSPVKPVRWDVPDPAAPALGLKPNGPVRVAGGIPVTTDDGPLAPVDRISLCRCGASRSQPECDGSHKIVGFAEP
jgi:CDGSH-type Zn-finger protein